MANLGYHHHCSSTNLSQTRLPPPKFQDMPSVKSLMERQGVRGQDCTDQHRLLNHCFRGGQHWCLPTLKKTNLLHLLLEYCPQIWELIGIYFGIGNQKLGDWLIELKDTWKLIEIAGNQTQYTFQMHQLLGCIKFKTSLWQWYWPQIWRMNWIN